MKNFDTDIEMIRPEEIQNQVEKMDKGSYTDILKRINSQLESARDNGSRSKVLACVDINMLEATTDIVRDIIRRLRAVGWKTGTKNVPYNHSSVVRIPDTGWRSQYDIPSKGVTGLRITVYHPSVYDVVIRNLNEYKYSSEEE